MSVNCRPNFHLQNTIKAGFDCLLNCTGFSGTTHCTHALSGLDPIFLERSSVVHAHTHTPASIGFNVEHLQSAAML